MRKFAVALTALATMGSLALMTGTASAQHRWGGGHWAGAHFGHWGGGWHRGFGWRRGHGFGAPVAAALGLGFGLAAANAIEDAAWGYPGYAYPWWGYGVAPVGYDVAWGYPAVETVYGGPYFAPPVYGPVTTTRVVYTYPRRTTRIVYAAPRRTRIVRRVVYRGPFGGREVVRRVVTWR